MKFDSAKEALLVLGINSSATRDDVKSAYRELLKLYHPDEKPSDDTAWQYYDIRDAYDYIMKIFEDPRIESIGGVPYYENKSGSGSVLKASAEAPSKTVSSGGRIIGNAAATKEMKEKQRQRTKAIKKDIEIRERKKKEEELEKRRADAAFRDAMEKINRVRAAERTAEIISAMLKGEKQ